MLSHSVITLQLRLRNLATALGLLLVLAAFALPDSALAQTVSRGPYLQMGAPTSMTVRWRSNTATDSVVRYGPSVDNLPFIAQNPGSRTEHEVALTGLDPATTYFYSVGNTSGPLTGNNADQMFITSPEAGTEQPTRIWVLGDSGTANANARAVRDRYLELTGNQYTDLLLMLGDNAYNDGTDSEYQAAVFNTYPSILRQTPVWSALGNHDGRTANVYYNIFTFPQNGEIGGLASGSEAYYSFDYANIHFIVMDSFATNRATNGAMMTWLRDDVLSHDQPWVIAFWHHPPYSKGSHNSDSEAGLVDMRQNALPILEAAGVDLVLGGHSHAYERSFLIDGHYGNSGSFNAGNQVDAGNGRVTGDGAYEKPGDFIADPNQGAVYVVAGSSGQTSGGALNHPAMVVNLNQLGSMILEVDGDTLDATFLNSSGAQPDTFRIVKTLSLPEVSVAASDPTATEAGPTGGSFTLSRTGDTLAALTVNYTTSGTATAGADYVGLGGSVTIAAGQTSATVDVTPLDDSLVERAESVILTLSANAAYQLGSPSNATVSIESDEFPPTVTIAATTPTATEAGPVSGAFTVTRAGDSSSALTVGYTVAGTATAGGDYAALSGSISLAAGATSAVISVDPIDDSEIEPDETVSVTLSADAAYDLGTPDNASVTIVSDEARPQINIAASDATATEAGPTSGSFTLTRSRNINGAVTVSYTVGGTATAGADYSALGGSVSLADGETTAVISVDPLDDNDFEPDETVVVTLSAGAIYDIGLSSDATVNIVSEDAEAPAALTLTVVNAFDNKNGKNYFPGGPDGAAPVNDLNSQAEEQEVELLGDSPSYWWEIDYQNPDAALGDPETVVITLNYRTESSWNGSFTAEYRVGGSVLASTALPTGSSGQAESFAWNLSSVVTSAANLSDGVVRLINDDPDGKKIFASFSAASVGFGGGAPPALPTVSLAVSDGTATEAGPTSGGFTVSRVGGNTVSALTVPYTVAGTATSGSDFAALSGLVTIAAGETSAVISVDPIDDGLVEADETVVLSLTAEPAFDLGTPSSGTVTVTSDDGAGLPVVSIAASSATATEAGPTSGAFTVSRAGDSSAALTVNYTVGGTATSVSDYAALSGSVTIAAGATSATISVDPVDDGDIEANETVVATLAADAAYEIGTPASGTVTIESDDVALPVVSLVASDGTATEAGPTSGAFTVSRAGDTSAALTVAYTVGGTATSVSDYAALGGSVTIAAGATSASISVDPVDDGDIEADETVVATLAADAAYEVGTPASGTVTIESDDVALPVVSIAASGATATEAGPTSGAFTVSRAGDTSAALTVNYTVGGTATSVSDYAALGGSVTIAAGATSATISVDPVDDGDVEADETVVATLAADAAYEIGASNSGTVTIVSDDVALPVVSLVASDGTATEAGPTSGAFTVSRAGDSSAALTVAYTVGGTATSVSDYAALSGSVTIAAGATSASISVDPVDDADIEVDETVVTTLAASAAYEIGTPASGTVTIASDDVAALPVVSIAASDGTATEAGPTSGAFTVSRAGDSSAALTVAYTVGGTATSVSDYAALGGSVTIAAGATSASISVDPVDDGDIEADETVVATLAADAAYEIGASNSGTVTIVSDDVALPVVSLVASDGTATEAGPTSGAFTVSRAGDTSAALTVAYTVGGTATSVSDYAALGGSVTIAAGATSASISVDPVDDGDIEADETVVATLAADAAYEIGASNSGTVTIVSDDVALPVVSLVASDGTATEAGPTSGAFTVSRAGDSSAALTVNYTVGGTATSVSDYAALSGSVTIAAGATSASISVDPVDDGDIEADETVVATLAADAAYEIGASNSGTVTIVSDDVALPVVSLVASDGTATEAGPTSGAFTVSRAGDSSAALTVAYTVGGTATSVSDYAALSGSVTIAAGQTSASISIDPVDDGDIEADETVVATLEASAAYEIGTPSSGTVTITSDDVALPVVSLIASDGTATEAGPTSGAFTVSRAGDNSLALTVAYTVGGTATAGADYAAPTGSVTIFAGQTSAAISIDPVDDAEVEADETVILTLSANAAYEIGTPASGIVTITSEDQPSSTPVTLSVVNLLDNKNGKNYFAGGPNGTDPLDDINTLAEEDKIELLGDDPSFWWEADYADPDTALGSPSEVIVTLNYRPEQDWNGSFTVEYRVGGTVLASTTLPGNSAGDDESIVWDLSSVVTTSSDLANGRLRFLNSDPDNGKKVFVSFSSTSATLGGGSTTTNAALSSGN